MEPKHYFIQKLTERFDFTKPIRLLDLGCGQARNFVPLLERFPNLTYVGIEPQASEAAIANEVLKKFPNAAVYHQLAYDPVPEHGSYDICISLSVLEHVKQIERFLANSVTAVKPGGHIIHRYDLGHALTPSSPKEWLQVWLGNHLPKLLPETKFVCYLDPKRAEAIIQKNGATINAVTYHQMRSHKKFLKSFATDTPEKETLAIQLLAWEDAVSPHLTDMAQRTREQLFPTICIWAQKK